MSETSITSANHPAGRTLPGAATPGPIRRFFAAASRLSKRVGQAEAAFILRIFYVVVFGGVAIVLRRRRRNLLALDETGPATWSPRRESAIDPEKQY
ncbi:MAG TPA: hypothetical protein VMU16_06995 [Candidatus Binataceae bacterium]|nr:hypothetical protein [Candidatus Binataceae bacterium]